MSKYTTNTSDRKKKTATLWWAIGAIGLLGFEYFYVGKIKKGIIKTIIGIFLIMAFSTIISASPASTGIDKGGAVATTVIMWAIFSVPNFVRISLGVFRDNVGAALRE